MRAARLKVLAGCAVAAALLFWLEREPSSEPAAAPEIVADAPTISRVGGASRLERVALGRLFTIEAEGLDAGTDAALVAALERLEELDARLSEWRPGSDVWAVNARAGGEPVEVHEDTRALLSLAKSLSEETDGLYEPTLGAVRVLWPFGDPSRPLPLRSDLERALAQVDATRLSVGDGSARLEREGMRIALDGLDVAFGMQAVMTTLRAHGVRRASVRAGADVLTLGEGRGAVRDVIIANPRWPERVVERFSVVDAAVATVDDLHRAIVREGLVLPPVLDPRSGAPARGCRSVTVVAPDPLDARAFATAIFVRGAAAGMAWAERRADVAALIIDAQGVARRSSSWAELTRPVHVVSSSTSSRPIDPEETEETDEPQDDVRATSPRVTRPRGSGGRSAARILIAGDETEPAFLLDRTEVTNAQYRRFLEAERHNPHAFCHPEEPEGHDHTPRYYRRFTPRLVQGSYAGPLAPFDERTFRDPDRPVVGVDFWDAWAFASWSGQRLPSRAELTRACAGPDGRSWPFGDTWDPSLANSGGERDGERDGHTYAAPADSFAAGASADGCLHLAGNVAEWTQDRWAVGGSSRSNPSGVACGAGRRREAGFRAFDLGFRCAADVEGSGR